MGGEPDGLAERIRLIVLAFIGLYVSSYLTLYQLGVVSGVWDPFLDGSPKVLHLFEPVPDAALGALAYGTEIALSLIGGGDRWRSAPMDGTGPRFRHLLRRSSERRASAVQPLVVGAWCTMCLASAAVSFAIFALSINEPRAALQHLERGRASGRSVRKALWGREKLGV